MAQIEVNPARWRLVEVGRVVLFQRGANTGRLGAIVEIIDHKRVLVEGPAENPALAVARHAAALSELSLTSIIVDKLPRAAGHTALKKKWQASEVEKKWAETSWAKKRAQKARRAQLSDFERFKVMKLRKQAREEVRKATAVARKAAA